MKQSSTEVLRVGIYPRVSTEEQFLKGYSLQTQEEVLTQYAQEHGYKIVGIYRDEGHSARKSAMKRPVMQQLLADVEAGKLDRILFIKLDRWFRNVREYHKIQEVLEAHHVTWQAIMEDYNTATADGRLKVNIMLSVAENESDRTSERIKFVFDGKRRRKEWCFTGGPDKWPYGYKPEVIDGVKRCVKDPETAPILQDFWDYVLNYNSVRKAGIYCDEKYGITRHYRSWACTARNEIYTGNFKGVADYCPAYISRQDWERIILGHETIKKTQRPERVYLFTGLLRCPDCGSTLKATFKSDPRDRSKEYLSYRCGRANINLCTFHHQLSERKVEKYLLANVRTQLEEYVLNVEAQQTQKRSQPHLQDLVTLNEQLRRLNIIFMAGNLSDEEYVSETKRLKQSIENAKQASQQTSLPNLQAIKNFLSDNALELYGSLSKEDKRRLWRSIISEIQVQGTTPIKIIPRP